MKYITLSLCLLFLFFPKGEMVAGYGDGHQVLETLFHRLNEKEASYLHTLLSESYAVGYYEVLNGFSHKREVAHLKAMAKVNLWKMQNDALYHAIFRKARGDGRYLTQYIARWSQRGRGHAHAKNLINESRGELMPGDILYISPVERSPISATVTFVQNIVVAENFGRTTFVSLLFLIAFGMTVGFIGAYCYPHVSAFKKVRHLFEC